MNAANEAISFSDRSRLVMRGCAYKSTISLILFVDRLTSFKERYGCYNSYLEVLEGGRVLVEERD